MKRSVSSDFLTFAGHKDSSAQTADERYQLRQEKVLPILAKFKAWLDSVFQLIDYN